MKVRSRQHAVAGSASDLDREPDVVRDSADPERDDALADAEQRNLVRLGLRRLGGRCEQLLTALFLATGDPSYEAISESLGMPIGSIGPTRARCFRKLEAILLDLGVEVPESTLVGSAGITTPVPRLLHP